MKRLIIHNEAELELWQAVGLQWRQVTFHQRYFLSFIDQLTSYKKFNRQD